MFEGAALPTNWGRPAEAAPTADRFMDALGLTRDPEPLLKEILSRDEFLETPLDSLYDRIAEMLSSLAERFFQWLGRHWPSLGSVHTDYSGLWTILGALVYALAISALIIAVGYLAWRLIEPRLKSLKGHDAAGAFEADGDAEDAPLSFEASLDLARQGKYRDALISLFRFVLVNLADQGALTWRPSWTNREILAAVRLEDPLRTPFSNMVTTFNEVRYGARPCDRSDYELFLEQARRVTGRPGTP